MTESLRNEKMKIFPTQSDLGSLDFTEIVSFISNDTSSLSTSKPESVEYLGHSGAWGEYQ